MRWLACAVLLGACYSPPSLHCAVSCGTGMAPCPDGLVCGANGLCRLEGVACAPNDPDGGMEAGTVDARVCFGIAAPPFVEYCPAMLVPNYALDGFIDTDMPTTCHATIPQDAGPPICVIAATSVATTGTARLIGTRPLMVIAQKMSISGKIDVAGTVHEGPLAAASNHAGCTGMKGASGVSGGGGAGGTFGGMGGSGGPGNGTTGAAATGTTAVSEIRGGCRGGDGGDSSTDTGSRGGNAGGAIYLAADTLLVDGIINASGHGGEPTLAATGGAGGGSGGMILLWSPNPIVLGPAAQIFALGGGGGTGGGATGGLGGRTPTSPTEPAQSETLNGAGSGGAGGSKDTADGTDGGPSPNGGGGGGGAVGIIKILPPVPVTPKIAPDPT